MRGGPLLPEADRAIQTRRNRVRPRQDQRLRVGRRHGEERPRARADVELRLDSPAALRIVRAGRTVAPCRLTRVPTGDRDRFPAPRRDRYAVAPLAPGPVAAVVGPWRKPP